MLDFLDSNAFIFTFFGIIIIAILVVQLNIKQFIIRYSQFIAIGFALIQGATFIAFVITNFLEGLWFFGLLQDLCPTISFISVIIFIWHKDNTYKLFMPWLIIGATVTMLGGHAFISTTSSAWITYIQHSTMLLQGICAYWWISKYTKKQIASIFIFPVLLIAWLFIVGFLPWKITGDQRWVVFSIALFEPAIGPTTVLSENGQEIIISSWAILGELGMPYPIPTLVFYILASTGAMVIVLNKNYFELYSQKIKNFYKKHIKINKLKK